MYTISSVRYVVLSVRYTVGDYEVYSGHCKV